jgi:cytochrome c-type biogenesis protein CcsB
MGTLALILLIGALAIYAVSCGLFVAHLLSKRPSMAVNGGRALLAGLSVHAAGMLARFVELGTVPATRPVEALNVLALVVGVVFVWVAKRYQVPALGAFATPLALVGVAAEVAFGGSGGAVPEALRSAWFPIHLAFAISGDAMFLIAGIASVAYLVQERLLRRKKINTLFRNLPPLHVLDEVCHRMLAVGFLLMTVGMVAGMFFAKQRWDSYWSWDPRQTWSLMTWLIFAAILHARLTIGWRGRRAAYLTILAVVLIILALVGLDAVFATRHGGDFS